MSRARIFIGNSELLNWTRMSLTRKKENLTGELSVEIFMGNIPSKPVYIEAMQGKDIYVYIDNNLAFFGSIDKRNGKSIKQARRANGQFAKGSVDNRSKGGEFQRSIGENGYKITLVSRGKTKALIGCSHTHKTGTIKETTDRKAIEELLKEHNIKLDWQAEEIDIDKIVFRDGAVVLDEVRRICNENCHFFYETRDGKLRVVDYPLETRGEDLKLGYNILTFEAEQSENRANSEIRVKGHRNKKGVWGKDAILDTEIRIKDDWVKNHSPLVIQHYGDATPEALERRAKWEADKRSTESKRVSIEVFDLGPREGEPWDIGLIHYVEVPPEGIFIDMECIELTYDVEFSGRLSTRLTLAPPPSKTKTNDTKNNLLKIPTSVTNVNTNTTAQHSANASVYPSAWSSAMIIGSVPIVSGAIATPNYLLTEPEVKQFSPSLTLKD